MLNVWHCPICKGPIARWVIQPALTCHHCQWQLSTNFSQAAWAALSCAAIAETGLVAALWLITGSAGQAIDIALGLSCIFGAAAWYAGFRWALRLRPLRPPAGAARGGHQAAHLARQTDGKPARCEGHSSIGQAPTAREHPCSTT